MRWTERQRALLREMGIEIWPRPDEADSPRGLATDARETVTVTVTVTATDAAPSPFTGVDDRRETASATGSDWDELRRAAARCGCGRPGGMALGSGHPHAHWMLVGDAPDGDTNGPDGFAGRAGALLDNMLRALDLTRADAAPSQQVYVASVPACSPSVERPDEPVPCAEFLLRQVQRVQPRVIVAMGRVAAQTLLRSRQPLGQLRGQLHHHGGIPLICTYHPAYLLRNPEDKARTWDDLCLAMQALKAQATA